MSCFRIELRDRVAGPNAAASAGGKESGRRADVDLCARYTLRCTVVISVSLIFVRLCSYHERHEYIPTFPIYFFLPPWFHIHRILHVKEQSVKHQNSVPLWNFHVTFSLSLSFCKELDVKHPNFTPQHTIQFVPILPSRQLKPQIFISDSE